MSFVSSDPKKAMSIVAETVITVSIELLLEKLVSKGVQLFASQEQIRADFKNWERKLGKIKVVLDDAQDRMITDQSVKKWLAELQNLAYDVEDVLDEFATEALRRNLLLESQPGTSTNKFRNFFIPPCCTNLTPRSLKFNSTMRSKVDEITLRLQNISTEKDQLELKKNSEGMSKKVSKRQDTTSLVCEAEVHGREEEKKAIVDLLLNNDLSTESPFSVIPITGMGGLGKTTLAQLVYNDKTVESHFEVKAWACVSEDFEAIRVTKAILKSIGVQTANDDDLNWLQGKLKNELSGKKFFIVLDDMWNENYGDWNNLKLPFVDGALGSKIIVTTRSQIVASKMGTVSAYELKQLSNKSSLLVFTQHSLGTRDFSKHPHLKTIGEEIVKKCNGLPLAAKTLGGLLRGKYETHDWKKVLKNKIWDLPEEGSDIMRALRVSYHYLPAHLKRCFAYCSLLPKDYEFRKREIVLLWMAEGLLQSDISEMEMEKSGHIYFEELQSRSFFQQSSMDASRFVMHDFINDLAQWAAGDLCIYMGNSVEENKKQTFSKNLRHLSYISNKYDGIKRFETVSDLKHLRTFLPLTASSKRCYVTSNLLRILPQLQRLRTLSLHGYRIFELPNEIGGVKHLRYLDLSYTAIEVLPESVSTLYNLQTLILENCSRLKKLFPDIGNLIKLQHLVNSGTDSLEEMPQRMCKLISLHSLAKFVVGKGICSGLRDLKPLTHLHEKLCISRLENVADAEDAKEAELNGKVGINALSLEWTSKTGDSTLAEIQTRVLEGLKPHHKRLKELSIQGYGGTKFPTWLEQSSFSSLVILRFENCYQCTSLPSVGHLPSLKDLFIKGMARVKSVDLEFYGKHCLEPFPSLERLCFEDMEEWEEWIPQVPGQQVEGFPCLQELSLLTCSKLKGRLPQRFPSLVKLVVKNCEKLLVSDLALALPPLCELEFDGFKEVSLSTVDPSSVNSVSVSDASRMESIAKIQHNNPSLKLIHHQEIDNLNDTHPSDFVSIPGGLHLKDQKLIRSMLSSLQILDLRACPDIASLPVEIFSPSLITLRIAGPKMCKSLFEQGLPRLTSLRKLCIEEGCPDMAFLPLLPTCITALDIRKFPDLESPSFIENLPYLERLRLFSCPKLVSFPEKGLPVASLVMIDIYQCPLLEEKCKKDKGKYWNMLAHLPYVRLDLKLVFDPQGLGED